MAKGSVEKEGRVVINVKQLKVEIVIVAIFVVIIGLFIVGVKALNTDADQVEYEKTTALYNMVLDYDYSKGESELVELKISNAIENNTADYYAYKAKIEYFYRLGRYHQTLNVIRTAFEYVPAENEMAYIYRKYVNCYEKLGNTEKAAEYQEKYNEYVDYDLFDDEK